MDKKGKLASFAMMFLLLLPILGLLIMNYQLEQANDLTGMAVAGVEASQFTLTLGVVAGVILIIAAGFKLMKPKRRSVEEINKDIEDIEKTLHSLDNK
ncbi:hypothetical protein ACFL0V_02935 [Nanoarchaeota archaeon]